MQGFSLPPLASLRAFEAAARHGSFTQAARELGMTQSAVSYQIKQLEQRLGVELFRRSGRHIQLTTVGDHLGEETSNAFALLRTACSFAASQRPDRIGITALPTVASHWLVPRLASFHEAHPGFSVQIEPSVSLSDMRRAPFDFAIRTGQGEWPGCNSKRLFANDFDVVLGADRINRGDIGTPSDILRLPLFGRSTWWASWAEMHGLEDVWRKLDPPTDLGTQASEVVAALSRHGAAIVTPKFFEDDLRSGRLIRPFPISFKRESSYWLVYREGTEKLPHIRAFRNWLLSQAEIAP